VLLIYALGGGWGHLTRAVALAHACKDDRVRILTNSPYANHLCRAEPCLDIRIVSTREEVVAEITSSDPECLIVDTFPRGIVGELVDYSGVRVLVQRELTPEYIAAADLPAFTNSHYGLVLTPGDVISELRDPPWLVHSPGNLSPAQARDLLRLDGPCILVCAAGNAAEQAWYGAVTAHLGKQARCIAPECPPSCPRECWVQYWPAMDLFVAAEVVVGGAGYNTIHECLACGVPLVARPWPRKYDRQLLRAQRAAQFGRVAIVQEPEEAASMALGMVGTERVPVAFQNGVDDAYRRIANFLGAS